MTLQERSAPMVIVAGHITVEPQQRESYLAGCVSVVEQASGTAGCLDFAITADLIDPGRVNIFERWESQAAVETFRSSGPSNEQGRRNALGVGRRVRHRPRAALVRGTHSMNLQRGPCHDR
jgi:quinol monooxygenase YgiN